MFYTCIAYDTIAFIFIIHFIQHASKIDMVMYFKRIIKSSCTKWKLDHNFVKAVT